MKRKCAMVIIYDSTKTTASRLIHVMGNADGVISCRVEDIEG